MQQSRTHWHERWDEGRIGFHVDQPNGILERYRDRLAPGRILVPLCGKSLDLWWLAEAGFQPVGVEFVPKAVDAFFAEHGVEPEIDGVVRRGGGVELHAANIFDFRDSGFDSVWDRAALIALPAGERAAYAAHIIERLRPGGTLLLDTLDYDQSRIDGPPWAVSDTEVRRHYASAGELERLEFAPAEVPPRMQEAGVEATESIWLLTKR